MKVLAITGGIGSGKSHIIKIFSALGIPAFLTDDQTKKLYDTSDSLRSSLISLLGEEIIENGVLNRALMASKIFTNQALLIELEKIVHPAVMSYFLEWKAEYEKKGTPFVIIESAIFLEKSYLLQYADKVLTISSPLDLRMERLRIRDGISDDLILDRIKNQWMDADREKYADFVIVSDGQTALLPQVLNVFNKMC